MQTEHCCLFFGAFVEKQVIAMEINGDLECQFRAGYAGHVVDVRVREENVSNGDSAAIGQRQKLIDFVAGIDENPGPSAFARHEKTILEERTNGPGFD
jgi:hypothetical protein